LDVIVGVNKYQIEEEAAGWTCWKSPKGARRTGGPPAGPAQSQRDDAASALAGVTQAAESGGNLLAACIAAVRARATVGEISDAMEKVFGRFVATTQCISGVYAPNFRTGAVIAACASARRLYGKGGSAAAHPAHQDGPGRP
jgi:methylmalonyl-CoA mutase